MKFTLLDRITSITRNKNVKAAKCLSLGEEYLADHFPGNPVMPGVLIIEAMAQVAGVLVLREIPDRANKLVFLAGVDNAKFRRPVLPGDQLRIEMKVVKKKASVAKMLGVATVDGAVVAEVEVLCKLADRQPKAPE